MNPEPGQLSPLPGSLPAALAASTSAFGGALDQLLAAMPADAARVVQRAAVPHWLDRELLAGLLDDAGAVEHALDVLGPLRFVHWTPDGRFRLHDEARLHLRQHFHAADPAAWRATNEAACSFFQSRAAAGADSSGASDRIEAVYHQLVVDEPAALAELGRRFDEAVWNHQLGLAEQYVRAAVEDEPFLSPAGREWLRYYEARLHQLHRRGDGGEAALASLARDATDPALAAAASLQLGRSLMERQRWQEGLQRLREAGALAGTADRAAPLAVAVPLATGDAYRDLAARSGGFPPHRSEGRGLGHWLRWLPFLAVRGMARRWRRGPSWWWWQAGTGYQDWLIAWLLERAMRWYRAAAAGPGTDARQQADVGLALAETSRQLGRWADARQRFGAILASEVVQGSPYGTARAQLGLGTVAVAAGQDDQGRGQIEDALTAFRRFGDHAGVGAGNLALGRAAQADGRSADAVEAYVAGAQALGAARDRLSQTEVAVTLAELATVPDLPEASRGTARAVADAVTERHYLARFPGSLLKLFRNLALYAALPITFVVGSLLGVVVVFLVGWVVESEWRLVTMGRADALSVGDHLTLLTFALVLTLLAVWLYPFVYGLLGMLLVRSLGRNLLAIEREPPAVVVTDPLAVRLYDRDHADGRALPWPDVTGAEAMDVRLWRGTVALLSRTAVTASDGPPLVIEAITAGYQALQADIQGRLAEPARWRRWDLALLPPSWVAGVLGVAVALVGVAGLLGALPTLTTEVIRPGTGAALNLTLTLTPALAMLVPTFVLLLTTLTHWRLVRHGRRVARATGLRLDVIPAPLLTVAAIAWLVLTGLWLTWLLLPA